MSAMLQQTIGNPDWMKQNLEKVKKILPATWTHQNNINPVQLGFQFKLVGIDWRSLEEMAKVMAYFEKVKLLQRDGVLIRVNPHFEL